MFKTIFGAILSVSFIVILATYTLYKFDNMKRYNYTNIQLSIQENYYTDRHPVKAKKNHFQVAFGIVSYAESLPEDVSEYGQVKARLWRWDENGFEFVPLPTHNCSDEEMGLTDDKQKSVFYPVFEPNKKQIQTYSPNLWCIDDEFELYGDYNSNAVSMM